MFDCIFNEIKKHDTIIIHRHEKPDGDAMGAQIGMKQLILENFPDKRVYTVGDQARYLDFMEDAATNDIPDDAYKGALAIILDCGSPALISDKRYTLAAKTLRMDHHIFCGQIADVEVIDTSFESCCGMVTEFARACHLNINKIAAKALYTGMVTDSGRFRYDDTNARTLQLASLLLEVGVDTNEIFRNLYADSYENKKLKAQFTLKIRFTPNNAAYIYTTLDELKELDVDTSYVSRGMVGLMSDMKGVCAWVNFTETENGVLCELRSDALNINPIAVKYGGGGHMKASGATVKDCETAMALLNDLDLLIGETR